MLVDPDCVNVISPTRRSAKNAVRNIARYNIWSYSFGKFIGKTASKRLGMGIVMGSLQSCDCFFFLEAEKSNFFTIK